VCVTCYFDLYSPNFTNVYEIDSDPGPWPLPTQLEPIQPPKPSGEASNFGDSSGPLFSIYSKAAEDEDNKMVERWQKDADGILIFVSPRVGIHLSLHINWSTIDWSVLCRSRYAPFRDRPGPEAKQSGYLLILSWEHLSGSHRSERNALILSLPCRQTTPVLPSEIYHLGEFSLVLELGHEP
jgi:hypothetical protein